MRRLLATVVVLVVAVCATRSTHASFRRIRPRFVRDLSRLADAARAADPPCWVVGGMMGSGKTTLAETLASELHVPHIEIDTFESEVTVIKVLDSGLSGWVVEANPWQIPDEVARRAGVAVYLDFDNVVNYLRLFRRGFGRWAASGYSWAGFEHFVIGEAVLDLGCIVFRHGKANRAGWRRHGLLPGLAEETLVVRCISPAEAELFVRSVRERLHAGHSDP